MNLEKSLVLENLYFTANQRITEGFFTWHNHNTSIYV